MTHFMDFITKPQLPLSSVTFYSSYYLVQKHSASGNTNVIFGAHWESHLNDFSYFANVYGCRLVLTKQQICLKMKWTVNMCAAVHKIMYACTLWYIVSRVNVQLQQYIYTVYIYKKKTYKISANFHSGLIWSSVNPLLLLPVLLQQVLGRKPPLGEWLRPQAEQQPPFELYVVFLIPLLFGTRSKCCKRTHTCSRTPTPPVKKQIKISCSEMFN